MRKLRSLSVLLLVLVLVPPANAQEGLKIYISADMEGLTGVVTDQQLGPTGFEYQRYRQVMTDEVLTAIHAAREAGASEILVSDSHGNGQNILIEQLPEDVMVVRSWPRPLAMMEGIDESFDGAIFIGYHASTNNLRGVRAHTMSSANVTDVRLNGVIVSEAGLNAAIAGQFGVPVIMISGDDAIVEEAKDLLGDVEGAVVKWAYSFHSALTLTPAAGNKVIAEKVKAAIGRISDFSPYRLEGPIEIQISLKHYRPVELLSYLPSVERVDSHTIRYVGQDMVEISKFLQFVLSYSVSVQP